MKTATLELNAGPGTMALYEAIPDAPADAAVVVVQEAYGVNSYIERVCRDLADAGYHAVAPHLFHRSGDPIVPYGDVPKAVEQIMLLDDDVLLEDVDAALDHLRGAGFADERIGIVGFCMGGRVTFLTVARRSIGAGVGFYGGAIVNVRSPKFAALVGEAPAIKAPWLGLFGDQDPSIPIEDVERLREALSGASVPSEIVRYPDAGHGFHCDQRDSFHRESAADGWRRTLAWFDRYLRKTA